MNRRIIPAVTLLAALFAASVAEAQSKDKETFFMFVQAADSAVITKSKSANQYRIVLQGVQPETIYFSDRPQRIAGKVENAKFIKGLSFEKDNPPNAAIVGTTGDKTQHIVVAELTAPQYDAAKKTLSYDVTLLPSTQWGSMAHWSKDAKHVLPASLSEVSLFIDDCPDFPAHCYGDFQSNGEQVCRVDCGTLPYKVGQCWDWVELQCKPCKDWSDQCNQHVCGPGRGLPPFCNVTCGSSRMCTNTH